MPPTADPAPPPTPAPRPEPPRLASSRGRKGDLTLLWSTRSAAVIVLVMLAALLVVMTASAIPSMRDFGLGFITSSQWRPNELQETVRDASGGIVYDENDEMVVRTLPPAFGALPVIYGTVVSSVLALLFAVPLSLGAALFLVRVAPRLRMAGPLSFLVEFLAAIPSISFGIWGLFVLAPFLARHVEPGIANVLAPIPGLGWLFGETLTVNGESVARPYPLTGRDMFCGSLVLAVMVLPIITAVSRDVLAAVPRAQIEGTLALGATWWQSCKGMLVYGRSGLFGAVMLGLARAAGETMAVTMVIGNNNQIKASPFAPAQTMSSLLANEFAEAEKGLHRSSLLYVALILLMMSLVFNVVARALVVGKSSGSAAAH